MTHFEGINSLAFRRSGVARNRFPVRKSIVKRIGMPPFQSPPLVAIPLGDPEFRFFFCMSPFSFGAKHRRAQPISVAGRRPTHWTRPISCSQGQTAKPKWESSVRRRRRNSFGNHERLFLFFFFLAGGRGEMACFNQRRKWMKRAPVDGRGNRRRHRRRTPSRTAPSAMIDVMTRAADDSRQDISRLTVC